MLSIFCSDQNIPHYDQNTIFFGILTQAGELFTGNEQFFKFYDNFEISTPPTKIHVTVHLF